MHSYITDQEKWNQLQVSLLASSEASGTFDSSCCPCLNSPFQCVCVENPKTQELSTLTDYLSFIIWVLAQLPLHSSQTSFPLAAHCTFSSQHFRKIYLFMSLLGSTSIFTRLPHTYNTVCIQELFLKWILHYLLSPWSHVHLWLKTSASEPALWRSKPLPEMPASHLGASWSPVCPISDPVLC